MTFVVNIIFRIISGPWHCKVLLTGFLALLATNTIIEVNDPGICAGFFINFNGVNGTGPQTRRIETLKTSPWLIIPAQVVFIQDDERKGGRVSAFTVNVGTYRFTGPTTRAQRFIGQNRTFCRCNFFSVG
jgi:hypothetical protein